MIDESLFFEKLQNTESKSLKSLIRNMENIIIDTQKYCHYQIVYLPLIKN